MNETKKRKAESIEGDVTAWKAKGKKLWRTPRKGKGRGNGTGQTLSIEPGDSGIWATCDMGKESRCAAEVKDLFEEYAERLYSTGVAADGDGEESENHDGDIEGEIKAEIDGLQKPASAPLFIHVKLDVQFMFFKTQHPVEPASLVHAICHDAFANPSRKRTRFLKRLTPMTLIGKATEKGLEELSQRVLPPHFPEDGRQHKFAIRPSLRNHNTLTRDQIIRQVALAVGPRHTVDLKGYDKLILVEGFKVWLARKVLAAAAPSNLVERWLTKLSAQNICGMSVVGSDFDRLKRYNLAEIYEPISTGSKVPREPSTAG